MGTDGRLLRYELHSGEPAQGEFLLPRSHQLGNPGKVFVFFFRQAHGSRRNVLLEMFDRGSTWDRQHDGRSPQEPSQRYLHGAGMASLRGLVKGVAANLARSQWEPRNKGNSIAVTIFHHVVPFAVGKAVAVLHTDDRDDSACSLDML